MIAISIIACSRNISASSTGGGVDDNDLRHVDHDDLNDVADDSGHCVGDDRCLVAIAICGPKTVMMVPLTTVMVTSLVMVATRVGYGFYADGDVDD